MTESTPVSSARATRSARAPSRVQIEPESPYGVSFAIRIASASSSNGITAATGPKTSSRATRSSFDGLARACTGTRSPGPSGASPRKSGSPSTKEATVSRCARRDQRAHLGRLVGRVADLDPAVASTRSSRKRSYAERCDEDARAGAAVLAGVVEDRVRSGGRGALEVGVGEDDVRRLAAELERHALDRRGGALASPRGRPRSSR